MARTRTDGIPRCYEAFRARSDNLLEQPRVIVAVSATRAQLGGGLVAVDAAAGDLLTALYISHYRELVRLAAFLTSDRDSAEEIVQDAYVKVHGSWRGVRELDKAEAYLRTTVVNLSRSRLRRRQVAAKHRPQPALDVASAETSALQIVQREAVLSALQALPRRQREAVVLRYYGDLTEAQTAAAMGCSVGSVKSHTSRAMMALRPLLEAGR
jgi:RNA polymerase sigma-70 factor (sigma-E family)